MEEKDFLFGDMLINKNNPRLFFYEENCFWCNASVMLNILADNPTEDTRLLILVKQLTYEGKLT